MTTEKIDRIFCWSLICGLLPFLSAGCGPETQPATLPAASRPAAGMDVSKSNQLRPTMSSELLKRHRRSWDADIWGPPPDQPGNAADDYVKALEEYKNNIKAIHEGIDSAKEPAKLDPAVLELIKKVQAHIAAGAKKREMHFTFVHTPKSFQVSPEFAPIDELDKITYLLYVLAECHTSRGEFVAAQETLRQMYAFGWHSAQDDSRVTMVVGGEKFGLYAEGLLAKVFAMWDAQHAKQAEIISKKLKRQIQAGDDKYQRVWGPNPSPADIFAIIAYDEDRAWRVDAILALGMLKFSHASDKQISMKVADLIERYKVSEDPLESVAARAAGEFTVEQYNSLLKALSEKK